MQHQAEPSRWLQAGVNRALGVDASFIDQNYKIKGAGAVKKKTQTKTKKRARNTNMTRFNVSWARVEGQSHCGLEQTSQTKRSAN